MPQMSQLGSPFALVHLKHWRWVWQILHVDFSRLDIRAWQPLFQTTLGTRSEGGRPLYNCPERNSLGRGHTAWLWGALHGLSWGRGQLFLWRWNWGLLLSYFFLVVFFTVLVISLKLSKAGDERLMSIGLWSTEHPLATALWCVSTNYCPGTITNFGVGIEAYYCCTFSS